MNMPSEGDRAAMTSALTTLKTVSAPDTQVELAAQRLYIYTVCVCMCVCACEFFYRSIIQVLK